MGVYLFRREVLSCLLETRKEWVDFGREVIPGCIATHQVYSYLFDGFWVDIGTVRSYYEVSMKLVEPNSPFVFVAPGKPIYSHPRYLPGSRIRDSVITDSIICEGSSIYSARVSNSIIGIRSVLRAGAEVNRSVTMGADYFEHGTMRGPLPLGIGPGTRIDCAIIDKNARVGKDVIIQGGPTLKDRMEHNYAVVDGIVVVLKNATIPDGTVIR